MSENESNDYKWVELAKASLQVQPVPISIYSALILVYISVCDVPKYLSVTNIQIDKWYLNEFIMQ